jgi:transposase
MDETLHSPPPDESAHTTSRKSARIPQVEIITRGERRRSWTAEQKYEIVAESLGSELTPTEVARKHAISTGQLYTWRHQLLSVQTAQLTRPAPRFAEVELTSGPLRPKTADQTALEAHPPSGGLIALRSVGLIEIVLAGGVVVRVDAGVDGRALRRVLDALEGR